MQVLTTSPGPIFSLAAFCGQRFDAVLARLGATAEVENVRSLGQPVDRFRSIYLGIAPGRHAALTQYDSQGAFEIALQRVGNCFFEHELLVVAKFAGLDPDHLERYCNPPFRFVADPPGARDRELWLEHVGSPYPYD